MGCFIYVECERAIGEVGMFVVRLCLDTRLAQSSDFSRDN